MIRRIFGFAALALLVAAPATSKGTQDRVYTAAQAVEGGAIYAGQCAMCHGVRLEGTVETPGLTGKFIANWAGRPVGDLFDYIGRAMPQMAPGTLQPADNARLVAFILQSNGAPAGNTALPADSRALSRLNFDPQMLGR